MGEPLRAAPPRARHEDQRMRPPRVKMSSSSNILGNLIDRLMDGLRPGSSFGRKKKGIQILDGSRARTHEIKIKSTPHGIG
jgi:hypothetical protein